MESENQIYLVIGGEGLLGQKIIEALINKKKAINPNYEPFEIRSIDIRAPESEPTSYLHFTSDICDKEAILRVINYQDKKVTTVFHTASPIMKAPPHVHKRVNIDGTRALLDVCKESGIKNFIYTSSASVVYSGAPLVYVDETVSYAKPFADYYSETKAIAEQMCLKENDPKNFRVVVLRPSGIFGPGDNQVTPGALAAQRRGFPPLIQIGDNSALFDFTYVDNLVDAHITASDKLEDSPEISGEVFFITNDQPIGMWTFLRMIWAQVAQIHLVKHEVPFVFGMTFTSRYFNISKAKKLLGYVPKVSYIEGVPLGVASTLERWKKEEMESNKKKAK
ncbi:hypothetical protein BB560_005389 [Smittium megazygosporum]|uniref:3-beta hydroxysteroid dehydrogenase/isomerase domain-containing protein n=1 Tax=Smittium megazygosporum TaxID=133381 RepID=A0A2T9Z6J3_9FUNG|nr:hypothetical protein BB560_005389 [Smittium megazygosporum]